MRSRTHKNARETGISLVEVLVSLVLLSTAAIAGAKLEQVAMRENRQSFSKDVAAGLARELIERTRQTSFANLGDTNGPNFVRPAGDPTSISAVGTGARGGFRREWRIKTDVANPKLKTIEVLVSWVERGRTKSIVLTTRRAK